MLAQERYAQITALLKQSGFIHVSDLMARFDVSLETIRRDLSAMEKQGILKRVHGGAVSAAPQFVNEPFQVRKEENILQKNAISETAVSLIQEGETIALDCGTTTLAMADLICKRFSKLTVATHSIAAFELLRPNPGLTLLLPGGQYVEPHRAVLGPLAVQSLAGLAFNRVFLCPSAVSYSFGYSEFEPECMEIQKAYLSNADHPVFLADSSKFNHNAIYQTAPLQEGQLLITDQLLPPAQLTKFRDTGVQVLQAAPVK